MQGTITRSYQCNAAQGLIGSNPVESALPELPVTAIAHVTAHNLHSHVNHNKQAHDTIAHNSIIPTAACQWMMPRHEVWRRASRALQQGKRASKQVRCGSTPAAGGAGGGRGRRGAVQGCDSALKHTRLPLSHTTHPSCGGASMMRGMCRCRAIGLWLPHTCTGNDAL
jgi:hypothetical protein